MLVDDFGVDRRLAIALASVTGGHHGVMIGAGEIQRADPSAVGRGPWSDARERMSRMLADVIGVGGHPGPQSLPPAAAMVVGGFISVADWIGSNAEFFPFAGGALDDGAAFPDDYAADARTRADRALERLGWTGWRPTDAPMTFESLFPGLSDPRPVQKAVVQVLRDVQPPAVVVVEAPTGEGKTEAAFYAIEHFGGPEGAKGAYLALPTQATSNQMFVRFQEMLARRHPAGFVNLQLLHGHASLSEEFGLLLSQGEGLLALRQVYDDTEPSGVAAAEWFTHRKRGLLAPFGVGTIDQALLGALRARHVFVRLFGLARKTVVVDEAHAYDTYMSSILERLLEWLGAMESPVVILSATLPAQRRQALLRAYAKGAGIAEPDVPLVSYPRLTFVSRAGAGAVSVPASALNTRKLALEWLDPPGAQGANEVLAARLSAALVDGGCAAVVCNTVARAQRVYQALRQTVGQGSEVELGLLHARFPFADRDRREKRAVERFGREGGRESRPHRAVLVATQVIEQSLDVDFDLLVTDLAPVDLVLQRMGRLHRHHRQRPRALARPTVWIRGPQTAPEFDAPAFDAADTTVYDEHILLRTWLALRGLSEVRVPDDLERLIEEVYDAREAPADRPPSIGPRWEQTRRRLDQERAKDAAEAENRWVGRPHSAKPVWQIADDPNRDEDEAPDLHPAHLALTRLAGPSVAVVCLREGPRLGPDGAVLDLGTRPDATGVRALLEQSLKITMWGLVQELLAQQPPWGWRRSPLLRHHRALVFDASGQVVVGRWRLRLDPDLGLVVEREGG